jgi:toxin secretion/phage lysis holin
MDTIIQALRGILPTQTQVEWGTIASGIGTVFSYFCGWDTTIEALLWLMVIDYVSGVLAAYINPHLSLSSQRGFRGICKKLMIILLVVVAHLADRVIGQALVQTIVVWFFIGNEGLSVIENAAKAGVPIPAKLRATLTQLAEEKTEKKGGGYRG